MTSIYGGGQSFDDSYLYPQPPCTPQPIDESLAYLQKNYPQFFFVLQKADMLSLFSMPTAQQITLFIPTTRDDRLYFFDRLAAKKYIESLVFLFKISFDDMISTPRQKLYLPLSAASSSFLETIASQNRVFISNLQNPILRGDIRFPGGVIHEIPHNPLFQGPLPPCFPSTGMDLCPIYGYRPS